MPGVVAPFITSCERFMPRFGIGVITLHGNRPPRQGRYWSCPPRAVTTPILPFALMSPEMLNVPIFSAPARLCRN